MLDAQVFYPEVIKSLKMVQELSRFSTSHNSVTPFDQLWSVFQK